MQFRSSTPRGAGPKGVNSPTAGEGDNSLYGSPGVRTGIISGFVNCEAPPRRSSDPTGSDLSAWGHRRLWAVIAPVIRRAASGDGVSVSGLFRLWPGHERERLQHGLEGSHVHFIAELDGAVIGYASLTPSGWEMTFYPGTQAMGDNWGFMPDLLVSPACRRQGIGARLVTAAEDHARAAGARGLAVNPDQTGDREALRRFYVRCGFEAVLPRPDDGPDGWPYFFKRF